METSYTPAPDRAPEVPPGTFAEHVTRIERSVERLEGMVHELLDSLDRLDDVEARLSTVETTVGTGTA